MSHFTWHSRWRRAFFAACLPYLLLAIFVDFFHADRPDGVPAPLSAVVRVAAAPDGPAAAPDYACPVCAWLRIGPSIETPFSLATCTDVVSRMIVPALAGAPDCPVPLPSLFRGPPSPALA
ncbi:MAG: hypothetical protein ACM3SQ_03630 [Betaproteobacteria bacterium]